MRGRSDRVHLVGIGGSGMSGLATLLREGGAEVSGSDLTGGGSTERLQRLGARIHIGHDARHLSPGVERVIVSSAIPEDNPEVVAARARDLPVVPRMRALGEFVADRRGVGVVGTHGKTTTTAMIATILRFAGLSPGFLVGAFCPGLGGRAGVGAGPWFVTEVDESDGRLDAVCPDIAVLTSVGDDHLGTYGSEDSLREAFSRFIDRSEHVVVCIDDPRVKRLAERRGDVATAGFDADASVHCLEVVQRGVETRFLLEVGGERVGWVHLPAPGRHNVQNALCAIAAARIVGVPPAIAAWGLSRFRLPERRFEVLSDDGVTVIDDYAHLPEEIEATLRAAREGWQERRLICVFEPHRYSRTQQLGDRFGAAFRAADVAVVTGVYAACEQAIPGVSSERIVRSIARDASPSELHHVPDLTALPRRLREWVRSGDVLVGLGAGGLTSVVREVAADLKRLSGDRRGGA